MKWVTFVGEGRSAHTIVSAILGSHPNAFIGEEQKYISRWFREKWTKEQIMAHLVTTGHGRARKLLDFPGILEYTDLQIVGDKCGWDAVNEFNKRGAPATILTDFGKFMGMPVKTIVTVRNPADNISAWIVSPKYERAFPNFNLRSRRMIRRYKRFYDAAAEIVKDQDVFMMHNEELIKDPNSVITSLCKWLDISCEKEWLDMCSGKIFKKPNKRSETVVWPNGYKEARLDPFIQTNTLMAYYR